MVWGSSQLYFFKGNTQINSSSPASWGDIEIFFLRDENVMYI